MTRDPEHPPTSVPVSSGVIAACFAALVFLGVSGPALASTSPTGSKSAGSLVAQARAAMMAAGSVSASGQGTTTVPGLGRATLTETDYTSGSSGSQLVTMRSVSAGPTTLPSAMTLDVAGSVFVNANAPFWTTTVGLGTVQSTQIAGRWVEVPRSSPVYAPAASDLTMSSLTRDVFHAPTYHKGGFRTIDGVRSVAITYTNTGNDSGPVTCYLAVGSSHLPVQVTIGGLTLHLTSWGRTQTLAAPSGAVPLPDSTSSSPSGLPVVA